MCDISEAVRNKLDDGLFNAESLLGESYVFSDDKNARDENDIVSLR